MKILAQVPEDEHVLIHIDCRTVISYVDSDVQTAEVTSWGKLVTIGYFYCPICGEVVNVYPIYNDDEN